MVNDLSRRVGILLRALNAQTIQKEKVRNRARTCLAYCRRQHEPKDIFPTIVHVELTNVCNLSCAMCPMSAMRRPKGYMHVELFKKIVDELARSPVEAVVLSLFGESLLHKQFPEFLRIASSAGLYTFLSTNGLCLSETLGKAILESGLNLLIISYDTQDPDLYARIRRGGTLSALEANVEQFLSLRGTRTDPVIVFQAIEFPGQEQGARSVRDRWRDRNVIVATRPAHPWLGDRKEINSMAMTANGARGDRGVCDQPWRHAVVFWDGRVGPCCNVYDAQVVVGDCSHQSLFEIWNGPVLSGFRKKHVSGPRKAIVPCGTCPQKAPSFLEKAGLMIVDMATINMYLSATDGWRE